ncbi:hypothetical protein F5Y11DRAFT_361359 [Daldinia sp. FL1419]|nr:hypothetical protein F5Y11DRAFT_361359 [Daldinia sp. FL1419]
MANLAIAFPVVLLALAAIAIYVQVTSSTLSFPISTGTTALTIILPFIAAANIFYTPLLRKLYERGIGSSPSLLRFLPVAPGVLQAILTVVLATLAAEGFSSGLLDCGLEGNWQRLYSGGDYRAIQRIQDTFNCCGFRSIKDRDSPRGQPNGQCSELHKDRHDFCLPLWRASMQRSAGLDFTVAVVTGIIQLLHLVYFFGSRNLGYRPINQSVGPTDRSGLLENGAADEEDGEQVDDNGTNDTNRPNYGGARDGANHRTEPSSLGEEGNNWR